MFRQKCLSVDEIDRSTWLCSVTIKGMQKVHLVRYTGNAMSIECRNVTCLYDSCLWEEDTQCPNGEYVDKYQSFDLQMGRQVEQNNLHWNLDEVARMNEIDADMEFSCI